MGEGNQGKPPEPAGSVLARVIERAFQAAAGGFGDDAGGAAEPVDGPAETPDAGGRYDFDLAEFPLFDFCKSRRGGRGPLAYSDTITGCDGRPVARTWKAYPGPFGVGGASTQALLYDLLQLYAEQGATGAQIQFGTLRSLFLRRGQRNPSKRDYDRMRRDIDVLRGYDFHCTNAFWDRDRRAYVDMNWRLFGAVFYFKPGPAAPAGELPFGFIEVSTVLRQVARTRGLFSLGFGSALFHSLKPLEQRLAVYLSKMFVSQKVHRRFADDLARALPVAASCERDTRKILKRAADGLIAKGLPILASYGFERSAGGRWVVTFSRRAAPRQEAPPRRETDGLAPASLAQVERIVETVGSGDDRLWWAQCVQRLGVGAVDRALGQLKESLRTGKVRNPGGLLTKIFKDIAREQGTLLSAAWVQR